MRVHIQWGLPQVDRQMPPGGLTLRPSLRESHVAVTRWLQHGPGESALDASMAQLSHVEILPSAPEGPGQIAPAVVLTVRSCIPNDASSYHQECQSIIDRWEVASDQPQSLHSAFGQLGSNGAGPVPPVRIRNGGYRKLWLTVHLGYDTPTQARPHNNTENRRHRPHDTAWKGPLLCL